MSLFGRLSLVALQRLRGSHSLALLREIGRAQWLGRDEALALQLRQLRALLEHAERNVPYYRTLFRTLGVTAADIRTLDDFSRLPVLTKAIVRERAEDLVRDDRPRSSLLPHYSGGSTGEPLRFFRDREYLAASDAGTFRNLARSGWRPGEMIAFFWGWNDRLERMHPVAFEIRQRLRRMYQFDPFRAGPREFDRWLRTWRRIRPRVALGYASTIAQFAEHLLRTGERVPALRGVFTTAEKLYPQQRAVLEQAFGCRVFDCYGSSEVQNIAAECTAGRMHVNADFVVLETEATTPGEPAPFLVTSLWNYAMPFIRYRNEDCGALETGSCSCGSGFPLLRLEIGRVSDSFVMPDGRIVHGEFFTHLMYGSEGIASFQFHQVAPSRIVLSLVPSAGSASAREAAVARARTEIQRISPVPISLEVREVPSIPLSAAGKHRFTRSDVSRTSGV